MPPVSPLAPAESASDRLLALADRCVQCGLCLPACPTYTLERTEAESPRGRIALTRAWERGTVPPTAAGDGHLDHCLGCRSCEAVCPAGVAYGELLTEARTRQRSRRGTRGRQLALEWLTARPRLLAALLGLYRCVFPALPAATRPLPRPPAPLSAPAPSPSLSGEAVALFAGCVATPYEAALRDAATRLCAATGTPVRAVAAQTCCGTLHAHGGNAGMARQLGAANREAFAGVATVLTLASGCHEAVRDALPDGITRDAIAFLHERAHLLSFQSCRERVALHLPCTQRNVAKSAAAVRALLARVPGLEVIELTAGYGCCGAAGTQMLLDTSRAASYRQPLIDAFERSGATRLLSANIGCRLHFANATSRPVQHPLEFLADRLA
ncbi:(Fe-S)-binding protein [Lysobacter solisilvae (ex Woo and Kim 2020)]|uniref:Glycolate oxidase iron-sulfur subunit n=1 Tax=Agrilutibacter terrestris TaxID=2865112 RepID=A0A7H0FZI1_9GAMM|nr:(Fe-S)-binding protein [Lysobacter terrestris]QNP41447.1 (Fe-S)-binding protein [Lysobacter terrestris]